MQKSTSGNVNNSSNDKASLPNPKPNNESKIKLENKVVEPKKVDSNFFDSDEETENTSKLTFSELENKSAEHFSKIMAKLKTKHQIKFKSSSHSIKTSKTSENQNNPGKKKVGMSNLFQSLFKEISAGEKICDDTFTKVNQESDVMSINID